MCGPSAKPRQAVAHTHLRATTKQSSDDIDRRMEQIRRSVLTPSALLVAVGTAIACTTPLSAMRGVTGQDEEVWIQLGTNDAGLWAMDTASIQTRDPYRWVWLRSYQTEDDRADRLNEATWRYVFIDCHDQRARFEQIKHMDWKGQLLGASEGNMGGINELKPYPPNSIIGNIVSTLCDADGLLAAQGTVELVRAIKSDDREKAALARAALKSKKLVVLEQ